MRSFARLVGGGVDGFHLGVPGGYPVMGRFDGSRRHNARVHRWRRALRAADGHRHELQSMQQRVYRGHGPGRVQRPRLHVVLDVGIRSLRFGVERIRLVLECPSGGRSMHDAGHGIQHTRKQCCRLVLWDGAPTIPVASEPWQLRCSAVQLPQFRVEQRRLHRLRQVRRPGRVPQRGLHRFSRRA
jgi:hypothetical protein